MKNVESSGDPGDDQTQGLTSRVVRDPSGKIFPIHASRSFGGTGILAGGVESENPPRVIRLLNRILTSIQRPHPSDSVLVTVYRVEGEQEINVLIEEHLNVTSASNRVSALAERIETGSFTE